MIVYMSTYPCESWTLVRSCFFFLAGPCSVLDWATVTVEDTWPYKGTDSTLDSTMVSLSNWSIKLVGREDAGSQVAKHSGHPSHNTWIIMKQTRAGVHISHSYNIFTSVMAGYYLSNESHVDIRYPVWSENHCTLWLIGSSFQPGRNRMGMWQDHNSHRFNKPYHTVDRPTKNPLSENNCTPCNCIMLAECN